MKLPKHRILIYNMFRFSIFSVILSTRAYIIHPDMYEKACWDLFLKYPHPTNTQKKNDRCPLLFLLSAANI